MIKNNLKKIIAFLLISYIFISCKDNKNITNETDNITVETINDFEIERFDRIFFTSKPQDLQNLKVKYPFFFPPGNADTVWTNKMNNKLLKELYNEVEIKYQNDNNLKDDLSKMFALINKNFKLNTPRVITLISEVDTDAKAIYTDSLIIISLDCYLGSKHKYYVDFPEYQRQNFEQHQILPDLITNFIERRAPYPQDKSLLSQMIYYGKELYAKDVLLPFVEEHHKIGYTAQQLQWCKENEYQMWSFFIDENLLFDTNPKQVQRFITPAPFSKFYLDIDNQSPGRVGQWIGWQIVKSYMKNHNISLSELLSLDEKKIFENSNYKPDKP